MERRVLIAVFLSFLVLYGYQALFVPPPPPPQPAPTQAPSGPSGTTQPAQPTTEPATTPAPPPVSPTPAAPHVQAVTTEPAEREITVETATVQAVLTNRGARIVRWRLKEYQDDRGQPLDLIPSALPPDQPTPFALRVDDEQITQRLNTAIYRVSGDSNGRVDATTNTGALTFDYEDAAGLRVRKEFRFDPRNYVVSFSAAVTSGNEALNPAVQWGPGLGDLGAGAGGGSFFTGNYIQPPQLIYGTRRPEPGVFRRDVEVERIAAGNLAEQPVHEGPFLFAGVDDHYFIAAAVNPGRARLNVRPVSLPGAGGSQRQFVSQTVQFAQPPQRVRFFFGPKQFDVLRSVDPELVRTINFGIFGFLAVPLLGALKWLYGFVGNYGWSIIALTILINLAIFPLRHKSVVSMRKMQQLQPQLKSIQDRYANLKVTDPARQKMNTEIMNLYREKGVNPASGCVPMLLTLPVLFAFYSLLSQAIEIRGAAFGLWLQDLSRPDPYYVTPILMGATMFWQQKITPTTADPTQQRIMMIMPLMFSFMFLSAPSGLVIYWFVSNLWAIGQQYFTNWLIGPPVIQTVRPPAERRLKNVGAGRTTSAERKT
jgi:YidC/Oxa1 family membrane protein insertase